MQLLARRNLNATNITGIYIENYLCVPLRTPAYSAVNHESLNCLAEAWPADTNLSQTTRGPSIRYAETAGLQFVVGGTARELSMVRPEHPKSVHEELSCAKLGRLVTGELTGSARATSFPPRDALV